MSDHHTSQQATSVEQIDRFLQELAEGRSRFSRSSVSERITLAESCADGIWSTARDWVETACQAKAIPPGSPLRAEEILAGPVAMFRYLRSLIQSLHAIQSHGMPRLPGKPYQDPDGRLRVPLFPVKGFCDRAAFHGFRATAWMQQGIQQDELFDQLALGTLAAGDKSPRTVLVLGAGNVSSIPAADTLSKLFCGGNVVLLKMSPVNDYLGPILQSAFASLIDRGLLRIIYGGADVGAAAIGHHLVDEVHITGSIDSHDAIVWGATGSERDRRKRENTPLLTKPITSELGNVSPWILVPGDYSQKQLKFQAENIAASVTNNASFNCVATKVLITWRQWPHRSSFLQQVEDILRRVPPRVAYYPGAMDRYRRFAGCEPTDGPEGTLPWTMLRDVHPEEAPHLLEQESFVCVFAEVALDALTPQEFFRTAVEFANERLWGTLCAAVTLPSRFRSRPDNKRLLESCLNRLRYGAVGINQWPGLVYAMMTPPWGGFPGSELADAQSGIGWVHNTLMLQGVEKTVLEGPLTVWPKPVWFSTHARAEPVAWRLLDLYRKPSMRKLALLLADALRG